MKHPDAAGSRFLNAACAAKSGSWLLIRELRGFLWGEIKRLSISRWAIALLLIQAIFTVPSIFIMNDVGFSFIGSVGVDHASMLDSMLKILQPMSLYNQMAGYHSSFYGWTYFFFSFWVLLPVKLIGLLFHANVFETVYIGLKILHVLYGFLACLSTYFLFRKFVGPFASFAGTLAFLGGTAMAMYGYRFHPEPIAVLFINLSLIYLYDFYAAPWDEKSGKIHYYATLLFLVLASLAKPSFLLSAGAIYLLLLAALVHKKGLKPMSFLREGGLRLIGSSAFFSVAVFFIVNPSFFLKLRKAIAAQIANTAVQTQASVALPSGLASMKAWGELLLTQPLTLSAIIATLFMAGWLGCKRNKSFLVKGLLFLNISALANVLFTTYMYRLFVVTAYLIPVMPVMMLNILFVLENGLRRMRLPAPLVSLCFVSILAALAYPHAQANLAEIRGFYLYRDTAQFKVYNYIEKSVPNGATIAHDQFVPIPDGKALKDYHFWWYSPQQIDDFHPDYVIYNVLDKFNGQYGREKLGLMHMTETEPYHLENTIGLPESQIEIWKKN